jgi:hypothetical protein
LRRHVAGFVSAVDTGAQTVPVFLLLRQVKMPKKLASMGRREKRRRGCRGRSWGRGEDGAYADEKNLVLNTPEPKNR